MTTAKTCATPASDIRHQINVRMYDRNIPSHPLQPYLSTRPVMTKYGYLPVVDPRRRPSVPLTQLPTYSVHHTFNPGNAMAPWSGFASNVNLESELRNQVFALQKCSQAVYVPSSTSDLYQVHFRAPSQPNPHPLLSTPQAFPDFNPNHAPHVCGVATFHNHTRCQTKDIQPMKDTAFMPAKKPLTPAKK